MEINLKYFGLIAECCAKASETMQVDHHTDVKMLVELLEKRYSTLKGKSYKLAVNQQWVTYDTALKDADEVALLPPFAGG